MECVCEKYKICPEDLENKLIEWLGEDAEWIFKLIKDTLYAYIELQEYRQLANKNEEKAKQLLKYIFDNAIELCRYANERGKSERWLSLAIFFLFSDKFREGMTRCELYPPCFGTIYFPTAPFFAHFQNKNLEKGQIIC